MVNRLLLVGDKRDFKQLLTWQLEEQIRQAQFVFAETFTMAENEMLRFRDGLDHIIVATDMGEDTLTTIKRINREITPSSSATVYSVDPLNMGQVDALIRELKGDR